MHSINLHGPWMLSLVDDPSSQPVRLKFPCRITPAQVPPGQAFELSRQFHAPTGVSDNDRVYLEFQFHWLPAQVTWNGKKLELPVEPTWQLEVGPELETFNQIRFRFESPEAGQLEESLPRTEAGSEVLAVSRLRIESAG